MVFDWYDLNNRHVATGIWLIAATIFFVSRCADVRRSVYDLLTEFLKLDILLPLAGLLVYGAVLTFVAVTVGRKEGIWATFPVVTSTVWALTAGVPLLLHLGEFLRGDNEIRSKVVAILGPSAIVTSIMSVAVLSFWWELILVPILAVAAAVLVYLAYANRGIGLVIVFSIPILAFMVASNLPTAKVIFGIGTNPETLQSLRQTILLAPVLTILTLPYIMLLVKVERLRFSRGAKCKAVTSSEYGKDWPLTVDSARLCCKDQAVWVEVNGRKFALNGTAMGVLKSIGFACLELNYIWKDHPDRKKLVKDFGEDLVLKVSTHRLLKDGFALER